MEDFFIDQTYEQNRRIAARDDFFKHKMVMQSEAQLSVPKQRVKKFVCNYCLSIN